MHLIKFNLKSKRMYSLKICIQLVSNIKRYSLKLSDNNSIHVIYKRPQNPSKYALTLEAAMTAQGIV